MTECPHCGQTLPQNTPPGLRLSNLKYAIYDRVRRAGPNGVTTASLLDCVYGADPNGGPAASSTLREHIYQINTRLRPYGQEIRGGMGPGNAGYVLRPVLQKPRPLTPGAKTPQTDPPH